jgi:hypothetical protein
VTLLSRERLTRLLKTNTDQPVDEALAELLTVPVALLSQDLDLEDYFIVGQRLVTAGAQRGAVAAENAHVAIFNQLSPLAPKGLVTVGGAIVSVGTASLIDLIIDQTIANWNGIGNARFRDTRLGFNQPPPITKCMTHTVAGLLGTQVVTNAFDLLAAVSMYIPLGWVLSNGQAVGFRCFGVNTFMEVLFTDVREFELEQR